MSSKDSMARDWDARAQENAMHYIVTRETSWSEAEFFEKGTQEAYHLCRGFFLARGFDPAGKRMLDIGCGLGRLDRGFSEMFAEVWGLDVSGEMVAQAARLNHGFENVKFVKGNGEDLGQFPDEFFDFVFSHITFQHIPEKRIIINYLHEIHRVLKPTAVFKIQLRKPWAGVAFAFGVLPVPRVLFPYIPEFLWALYGRLALRGERSKLYRGKTWRGSGISEREVKETLRCLKFEAVEISNNPQGRVPRALPVGE